MQQIDPRKLLLDIVAILDKLGIPYLITGGMAVFVWGRPRFTAGIDMVVELPPQKVGELEHALKALGESGYVDREAMRDAVERHGEFNFIDSASGMKVYFCISKGDPFDRSRMERRVPKTILGRKVFFSSAEDLILSKLRWHTEARSSRHLEDIESILSISGNKIDMDYLKTWAETLGYSDTLREILRDRSTGV